MKKSDERSSFFILEKKSNLGNLEVDSWNRFIKKSKAITNFRLYDFRLYDFRLYDFFFRR